MDTGTVAGASVLFYCLNAIVTVDYDCPCPRRKYLLLAIGTGQNWKDKLTQDMYIGTVLLHNDSLVLHYLLIECNTNQLL